MTKQNLPEFKKIMFLLAEFFPKEITTLTLEAYFGALKDLPIEKISKAASDYSKSGKFFPKPAELRELTFDNSNQLTAGDAWDMVMKHLFKWGHDPRFYPRGESPPALPPAVSRAVKAVGGLNEIGMTENGLDIIRAHFFKCFRENQEQEKRLQLLGEPTKEEAKLLLDNLTKQIPVLAEVG